MSPSTLSTFGKYEIVRKLGRSMTDVYLALDPETNRKVVLKIVEQCNDSYTQVVVEAERRGAAIQQQLHQLDARILEVYETGEQNGCFFVAMQYAEGRSLAAIVEENHRLDPVTAARYAEEVLSQLVTLHSFLIEVDGRKQAIVHGDIKPSNIQIGPKGEVWLLDFGIAKAITATRNLTQHNFGSPAYCSPERLRRGQVDPFADLWAVGVSLYEMITGLPPYHAQSTRKLENLIQSRRPPRALPEDCPQPLRSIIHKALAADFERRYASAQAFQADLRAFIEKKPTAAEGESNAAWDSNATIDRVPGGGIETRPAAVKVARWNLRPRLSRLSAEFNAIAWPLIGGLSVGLILFIPASSMYQFWHESAPLRARRDYRRATPQQIDVEIRKFQELKRRGGIPEQLSLIRPLASQLHSLLVEAGDDVLEAYRGAADSDLGQYDWAKARYCFNRAVEVDSGDTQSAGKRALADGYLALTRTPPSMKVAETSFTAAVKALPKSPDPHLGLARVYVYGSHNMGRAMAEFHAAERLGYKPGPRESEQQADGYLFRAEQQLRVAQNAATYEARRRLSAQAERDLDRARELYEPLAGFSRVNERLDALYADTERAAKLAQPPPVVVVKHKKKSAKDGRRWR